MGVSPRGTLALYRASQAAAALQGRNYVIPDDIKQLAMPVWAHRLVPALETRLHEQRVEAVLQGILERTPVPVEEVWQAETEPS
ncbi:hypothetical protein FKZ61_009355 [Litorilinea aerophila]|nr:hypothetical protein [Litorilinea aerophila]